jgi:hypothetical protein
MTVSEGATGAFLLIAFGHATLRTELGAPVLVRSSSGKHPAIDPKRRP